MVERKTRSAGRYHLFEHSKSAAQRIPLFLAAVIAAPVAEELVFRSYLYSVVKHFQLTARMERRFVVHVIATRKGTYTHVPHFSNDMEFSALRSRRFWFGKNLCGANTARVDEGRVRRGADARQSRSKSGRLS